jgi:hypothetical protein
MNKKIVYASALAAGVLGSMASINVHAANTVTTVCAGGTGGSGTVPASGAASDNFMVSPITPKCSANVLLQGMDGTNGAYYAVGSASSKGKFTFKGSTAGGGIAQGTACSVAGGCTSSEVNTAMSAAPSS